MMLTQAQAEAQQALQLLPPALPAMIASYPFRLVPLQLLLFFLTRLKVGFILM